MQHKFHKKVRRARHITVLDFRFWKGLAGSSSDHTPSVQELSTNFRSKYRENLVHTSLESSLHELSSDTWFSTGVSEW